MNTTMTTDVTIARPTMTPDYLPPPDPKAVEQAMLVGDISQMTDAQRIAYYVATCKSLNLNPLTKPFQALKGDDGKVTLYPDKGCAEQLRKLHRVSVRVVSREFLDDLYIVTVRATTPDGREEESQGVVPVSKPKGTWEDYETRGQTRRRFKPAIDEHGLDVMIPLSPAERATAIMRAESKAKRRVTLAICGLGLPDWDQEPGSQAHPMALSLQREAASVEEPVRDVATIMAELAGDPALTATRVPQPAQPQPVVDPHLLALREHIEVTILASGGELAPWYAWAERRLKKPRATFTVEDYTLMQSAVEKAAELSANLAEVTPTEASADQPDLWRQEEEAERLAHEQGLEH
jgi:hypothetical protein